MKTDDENKGRVRLDKAPKDYTKELGLKLPNKTIRRYEETSVL